MSFQIKELTESVGTWIKNYSGETIGKVEDIKIDTKEKIPEYLILCCNELFGNGDRYFAIPVQPSLINIDPRGIVTLNVDKKKLQNATGIHADECPKFNPEFSDSVIELYHYSESKLAKTLGRD